MGAVAAYLRGVHQEAERRGYRFDATRVIPVTWKGIIQETTGQLLYEWQHLLAKTALRSPAHHATLLPITMPDPHPLFLLVDGEVRTWERIVQNQDGPKR